MATIERRQRFGLRKLFGVVAAGAVLSEVVRAATGQQSPLLIGMCSFCVGGMVGIGSYVAFSTMFIIATRSVQMQRIGAIGAAVLGSILWLACVVVPLQAFPPICLGYATIALGFGALIVKESWQIDEGHSPEQTLRRLLATKAEVDTQMSRRRQRPSE